MARNSKFRSTSGPTRNRPQPPPRREDRPDDYRGKSDKDRKPRFVGGAKGYRKETGPEDKRPGPSRSSERSAKDFGSKGGFEKRDEAKDFRRKDERAGKFEPRKERSEGKYVRSDAPGKGFRKKDEAKGDFKGPRKSGSLPYKRKPYGKPPRPDGAPGAERKSFVDSRLSKQYKSVPATPSGGPKDDLIRLNKFISNSGVCSRREADDLIKMGVITVNGNSVTELGYKVKPTDDVRYDGKRLKAEKPVYILLNKPKGFITTTDDPQERNTVMHLIAGACKERVYPVGRLDRNTSGLLLLTNDGDLTEKLSHPSHNVKKIYKAELDKPITKEDFQKVLSGVRLEEGKAIVDDLAVVSDDGKTVGLEIHIGWNRIVRRIFEALGYEVVKLDRSVYATLDKKDLPRGNWRFLRQDEVIRLKHFQ
ncbi:MAG TPA: pseudouridine synthase [Cyclobacteriaceae bacterium]|nr:pseudouridine synthase [Cyclobacteriaceae bacterium]